MAQEGRGSPEGVTLPGSLLECVRCPRLVSFRESCEVKVPRRFRACVAEHGFWGRPVPGFGDPNAVLAIVGLAPAAFGANRTGRMFTGDRSGDFLFRALFALGLASAGESRHREDGLTLQGVFITAVVRCAPPQNRPTAQEVRNCRPYLVHDLTGLSRLKVLLALGHLAHGAVVELFGSQFQPKPRFAHGAVHRLPGGLYLVDSYHVSQQNTFTGRLTAESFQAVLRQAWRLAQERGGGCGQS